MRGANQQEVLEGKLLKAKPGVAILQGIFQIAFMSSVG